MSIQSYGDSFFTPFYGAFRWHSHLCYRPGTWALIGFNLEFDRMRGIENDSIHITCVVDDFGNLVRVPS
jgi:hypothetical protein